MSAPVIPVDAAQLRAAGRQPAVPFCVALADGEVVIHRLLRVLPGKRIVGEGRWQGRPVLAKIFVAARSEKHWAQEKAGIEALCRARILTPELLWASPLPAGGHVLLTAFIENGQSLAEAWGAVSTLPAGEAAVLDLLCPAFEMLGRLHASGLLQQDLHLGNFLRGADQLYAIDGDAVRALTPGGPLNAVQATDNLALLLAQLPQGCDVEALVAAYVTGGGHPDISPRRLVRAMDRARAGRLKDYLGKTLRDCTDFSVRQSALRFAAVQREAADRLTPLLESPDAAIAQGVLLKDGRTCTVARVEESGDFGHSLVIKRYNLKNLLHAVARFWRPSRAWHSWREGHRLRFLGIATPLPLALMEERFGPFRRRAYLVNAYCPGVNLETLLSADQLPDGPTAAAILSLFEALHALRISHGDLKATNLLWHDGRVLLIDLDAVKQHRFEATYARAWRGDRERLLRNWPASSVLHQWLDTKLPPVSTRR